MLWGRNMDSSCTKDRLNLTSYGRPVSNSKWATTPEMPDNKAYNWMSEVKDFNLKITYVAPVYPAVDPKKKDSPRAGQETRWGLSSKYGCPRDEATLKQCQKVLRSTPKHKTYPHMVQEAMLKWADRKLKLAITEEDSPALEFEIERARRMGLTESGYEYMGMKVGMSKTERQLERGRPGEYRPKGKKAPGRMVTCRPRFRAPDKSMCMSVEVAGRNVYRGTPPGSLSGSGHAQDAAKFFSLLWQSPVNLPRPPIAGARARRRPQSQHLGLHNEETAGEKRPPRLPRRPHPGQAWERRPWGTGRVCRKEAEMKTGYLQRMLLAANWGLRRDPLRIGRVHGVGVLSVRRCSRAASRCMGAAEVRDPLGRESPEGMSRIPPARGGAPRRHRGRCDNGGGDATLHCMHRALSGGRSHAAECRDGCAMLRIAAATPYCSQRGESEEWAPPEVHTRCVPGGNTVRSPGKNWPDGGLGEMYLELKRGCTVACSCISCTGWAGWTSAPGRTRRPGRCWHMRAAAVSEQRGDTPDDTHTQACYTL
eukprot:gene15639-biopygen254